MNRTSQQGLSLVSVLIVGVLAAFLLLMGFRCVPAITEFMAVEKVVRALAEEGNNGKSVAEIRNSFEKRRQIDDIVSFKATDLEISKGNGNTVVSVEYGRKVPIAGNVSLLFDFSASSDAAY